LLLAIDKGSPSDALKELWRGNLRGTAQALGLPMRPDAQETSVARRLFGCYIDGAALVALL